MNATTFRCPCGADNEIEYEVDGPEVLDCWSTEDGLACEVCGKPLDRDAVYTAVSIEHAENLADGPTDREYADHHFPGGR